MLLPPLPPLHVALRVLLFPRAPHAKASATKKRTGNCEENRFFKECGVFILDSAPYICQHRTIFFEIFVFWLLNNFFIQKLPLF